MTSKFDIGIIIPIDEEFEFFKKLCPIKHTYSRSDAEFYYVVDLGLPNIDAVALILNEMGVAAASQKSEKLLHAINVRALVLLGIAGSLEANVRIGDVVIGDEINQFQAVSKAVSKEDSFKFQYSGSHWRTPYSLVNTVRNFRHAEYTSYKAWQHYVLGCQESFGLRNISNTNLSQNPAIHIGHIASGDTVAASEAYKLELLGIDRKFLAIEMEAAGIARVAYDRQPPVNLIVVRGISDVADSKKTQFDDSTKGHCRKLAMYSATKCFLEILKWQNFCMPFIQQEPLTGKHVVSRVSHIQAQKTTKQYFLRPFSKSELMGIKYGCNPLGFDVTTMEFIDIVSKSRFSIVAKYYYIDSYYIVKRTENSACHQNALRELVGKDIHSFQGNLHVTIATPLAVWSTGKYTYELHYYYNGRSIFNIIKNSKNTINGEFIGDLFNGFVFVLDQLHSIGILHRDIRPHNFLMRPSGDIVLLDCTFCCQVDQPQIPVKNASFSPPEQGNGTATKSSDLYAFGATVFYLVNGFPPFRYGQSRFEEGLSKIDAGPKYDPPSDLFEQYEVIIADGIGAVVEVLLKKDVACRPQEARMVELWEHSAVIFSKRLLSVLEVEEDRYFLVWDSMYEIVNREEKDRILSKIKDKS